MAIFSDEFSFKDGRRPNTNGYRSFALSVGPDVLNDSRSFPPPLPYSSTFLRFLVNENQKKTTIWLAYFVHINSYIHSNLCPFSNI